MRKNILFLILYTSLFLGVFLLIGGYFFTPQNTVTIEDTYLEKSKQDPPSEFNTPLTEAEKLRYSQIFEVQKKKLKEKKTVLKTKPSLPSLIPPQKETSAFEEMKLMLSYTPTELKNKMSEADIPLTMFLDSPTIDPKVYFLGLELYEKENDVR
jgi:hypothetical protein